MLLPRRLGIESTTTSGLLGSSSWRLWSLARIPRMSMSIPRSRAKRVRSLIPLFCFSEAQHLFLASLYLHPQSPKINIPTEISKYFGEDSTSGGIGFQFRQIKQWAKSQK